MDFILFQLCQDCENLPNSLEEGEIMATRKKKNEEEKKAEINKEEILFRKKTLNKIVEEEMDKSETDD